MQFVKGGPDVPERLLQAHEDGQVVFFCGAGISYPAGLPSFKGLVKELYSSLGIAPDAVQAAAIKAKRYDTAVGLLEANPVLGRRTVRETIAEILQPDTSSPNATATHEALLILGKCRERRTRLITTNFDRLFEHVMANDPPSAGPFVAPLLPVPKQRWDGLVYLHGLLPEDPDNNNLDNLVVSSGDFGLAYLTERWAARFISELVQNFVVCFVGYSIEDPVLRYMMDALAADRLLGESPPEMFAFGSYSKGRGSERANEWRSKNVSPILYREHRHHAYLHRTLRAWANTYRDGVRGKERIVMECAMASPGKVTRHDDFVSRMLWALSEPSGLPAKQFANLNPAPSLDWLEAFATNRFQHADLVRFGIPPKASVDEELAFSLTRRPAPYDLAPHMALADWGAHESRHDMVMTQLTRWLTRHLGNPALLLWLVKQGGKLHSNLAERITRCLDDLAERELCEDHKALDRIRKDSPDAVPDEWMRTLWGILLTGRVKLSGNNLDLYRWRRRFEKDGLTTTLRFELREKLSPCVSLRAPFRWPIADDEGYREPKGICRHVDWEVVLAAKGVHGALRNLGRNDRWTAALPTLLGDFTGLLRDVLDLMRELGGADDRSDLSYVTQPSISEHSQNSSLRDWTALIELNRDAWLAAAAMSSEEARLAAESWSRMPYPVFRRLAFFAAAQSSAVPPSQGLEWLLADDHRWLWSVEIQRETMRLLVALSPQLDGDELVRLEQAILAGPPRDMYRDGIEDDRWTRIQESKVWLRLIKMRESGAELNISARNRLDELSAKHPAWRLSEHERDEFPTWMGAVVEPRIQVMTPRDRDELTEWLRENSESDNWRRDDWRERCRDDFGDAVSALIALSTERRWPASRWNEALQVWSDENFLQCTWLKIAPVLVNIPDESLQQMDHAVSWWLGKLAKRFEGQETAFLSLCDRVLALDYEVDEQDDDPVGCAINHPVGHVTEALLNWWYRNDLEDGEGLADELKLRFANLCDTEIQKFRHGRVLLAGHVISLFRVDREWTTQFLLPLFQWANSEAEASAVWEGFLSSPRLYRPVMEEFKPAFLDTAKHYSQLGRYSEQYASLLTFVALDPTDIFSNPELASATRTLPQQGLDHVANTLFQAVDSAGDQRAEYWRNRGVPYLRWVWPKTPDIRSETVSESLARACIAAGEAFPEALKRVQPWLQPLQYPDDIAHELHDTKQDVRFPGAALELLNQVVRDRAGGYFPDLTSSLKAVRNNQPELERDPRFERLQEIVRANGGDMD